MNRRTIQPGLLAVGIVLFLLASAVSAQQSIMVTGNSISAGSNQPSFRLPLLDSLAARGCSVDMVGDQHLNSFDFQDPQTSPGENIEPFTPAMGYDTDHQAFPDILAEQLLSGTSSASYTVSPISAYTLVQQPDYVLLHLGTNDLNLAIVTGTDTDKEIDNWVSLTTNDVESVIDQIIANHATPDDLRILVANFVPYVGSFTIQSERETAVQASLKYTKALESMVAARADSRVLIVDVATDFDVNTMLASDNVNPNSVGEQHIAGAFLPILKGAGLCPANVPVVNAPLNGSLVKGDPVTIDWNDNGLVVDNWRVYVGDTQSGNSTTYFDSGVLGPTVRSVVVPSLPEDHSNVFVALNYQVDGIWDLSITSFISGTTVVSEPTITSPTLGTQLPGADIMLRWSDNGVAQNQWYVRVGLSKGTTEFANVRITDPATTHLRVSGLPTDGVTPVFVEFSYRKAGAWTTRNFKYLASDVTNSLNYTAPDDDGALTNAASSTTTASNDSNQQNLPSVVADDNKSDPQMPGLTYPMPGTQLPGAEVLFEWSDNGIAQNQWYVRVGLSIGTTEFANMRITDPATNQLRVNGLPTDGVTPVFVEFSYRKAGAWTTQNFEYLAADGTDLLNLTTPDDDGALPDPVTSTTTPIDDSTNQDQPPIAVDDAVDDNDSISQMPGLTSPMPDSQLPGADVMFKWSDNGEAQKQWYVRVGLSTGKTEFANVRITDPSTMQLPVSGLPTDGVTPVFVEFSYRNAGAWTTRNFEYLAFDGSDSLEDSTADDDGALSNPATGISTPTNDTNPQNQPPVAMDDTIGPAIIGQSIVFSVTSNDTDSDGYVVPGSINIVNRPQQGTASIDSNGQITYTHDGTLGALQDILTYTILDDDGAPSNEASVRITPFKAPLLLTTPLLIPIDISFDNPTWSGNPFDLLATATFTHEGTNAMRTGELYYDGNNLWKLRFVADLSGTWTYATQSADADLNNRTGSISVANSEEKGYVVAQGDKWTRSATGRAFVPQYVMAGTLKDFAVNPDKITKDLNTFMDEHGFTGFHIRGYCQWFKLGSDRCSDIPAGERDPDPETFAVIENIITQTSARGGTTHIWMYGDNSRRQNPTDWGLNGTEDQRMQRYLAARLGALPGWTIGYGYDVSEWASPSQIETWYTYLDDRMMHPHLTSARGNKNSITQHSEILTYSSYEQHRPDYNWYSSAISDRPEKPSFSEDRFRVDEKYAAKDYTLEQTRRGMWHSAMAGGVANIWGNLQFDEGGSYDEGSRVYPNKQELKIYSDFITPRFRSDFESCDMLADAQCLQTPSNAYYIVYKEDTNTISIDLSNMIGPGKYTAMDTTTGELSTGSFLAAQQTWTAPFFGDWVIEIEQLSSQVQ